MRKSKHPRTQLSLVQRIKPGRRGGTRPGAGRPRKPGSVSHDARPSLAKRFPQHVTLRIAEGVSSLARDYLLKIIRRAIAQSHKPTFRVCEFNILGNHAHFITEADNEQLLARGMQGLEVRLARRLNFALMRKGKLFAHRYHARILRTPREVRNCLAYVLLNRKHHDREKRFAKYWIDPHSSAAWFDGWAAPIRVNTDWKHALVTASSPVEKPHTWLLSSGWLRHGPLAFDERPS